jgi:urea transport system permease protein
MPRRPRWFINSAFCLLYLCFPLLVAAQDGVVTGDLELDPIFSNYVDGDRNEALDTLAALPRQDKRALLTGILEGDLMLWKTESRVVRVEKNGRDYVIFDLASAEELGTVKKRRLSRLKLDNRLRGYLRNLIASLGLESEDTSERLVAVRALISNPDSIERERVEQLIENESNAEVLAALAAVQARQLVSSSDPTEQRAGIDALAEDLSSDSRRAIREIANAPEDDEIAPDTREAAQLAMVNQEKAVDRFRTLETIFFGLSLGSVLVLAAIGLAITFGVMGVINMAHGELIMLGAYCAYGMQLLMPDSLGTALLLSIPVAFLFTGTVGVVIERTVIRFLYGRPLETLLATFGISLILQQLVRTTVSAQNVPVANPAFMSGTIDFNPVFSLTLNRLYILAFCLIVFFLLLMLLKHSRFGLEMRAVSQNRAMARAMGVRSSRIDALTFGLGAGIAGIAGVALSQLTNVGPNLGQAYIVDSFMVVVFGGVGNLWGTLIGGMTLGVANKLMEPWAGAILAKVFVLVFLILFIQRRPRGLFPQRGRAAESH